MDSEIVKGKSLTKEETKFLLELIEGSKIITSKSTNATNNKLKTEEWIRLTERFNATATNSPPYMAAATFEMGKFEEKCTQTQHQKEKLKLELQKLKESL